MKAIPRRFFVLFDVGVVVLSFLAAYSLAPILQNIIAPGQPLRRWVEFLSPPTTEGLGLFRPFDEVVWVGAVVVAAAVLVMNAAGGYRPLLEQSRLHIVGTAVLAAATGLAFVSLVPFALHSPRWSRLFVFSCTVFSGIGLCGYRVLLRSYWKRRYELGLYARDVVLVGPTSALGWLTEHFRQDVSELEYRLLGYLRLEPQQPAPSVPFYPQGGVVVEGQLPALGSVDDFGEVVVNEPIHDVIAVQPSGGGGWLKRVIEDCDYFRVSLHIVPESLIGVTTRDLRVLDLGDRLRLPQVILEPPELRSEGQFAKRLIDIVVSAALLVVLSPLFLLIALAIKITTPALPVFYRYRAVGYKGRYFVTYKFTSMSADAERRKAELLDRNQMKGPVFKMKHDPRVTKVGRCLRKYSLDELPQLWSVLKGEMSLVGPRPAPPHEVQRWELWHKRKLSVRPGITCLWQVSGRNRIADFDDWVKLDFEYINNWSLWLDAKIMMRTAWVVVTGTGW